MHEITILSGKGGTGKTTISAALATLSKSAVICDNDVDAADLFLLLHPIIKQQAPFVSGWTAHIATEKCSQCGVCISYCRFNAIQQNAKGEYEIKSFECEGCRLCEHVCPDKAITSHPNQGNTWFSSDTHYGPMIHAQMGAGEENSGKLVTFIRNKAKEKALQTNARYIINDGPPGVGCPVIASLAGSQQVLLVIEPTQSGWHDVSRLIELINSFRMPISAIINKAGINPHMETKIEAELKSQSIPLLGKLPYSKVFRLAMLAQKPVVEYAPQSDEANIIRNIWNKLKTGIKI